ncbi:uncharacterized protein LOC129226143 [Uloborus diversus]|uniref:uncharacterized protein LOC129226143 n=1 Tax=Uloborus diversus TaxID=327109 RepID=UPI002409FA67|nr:uncharacterized protein LOC129226143 [Uloborus diversus]
MDFCNFPPDYNYLSVGTSGNCQEFRVKEIVDEISAKVWLKSYSYQSKTTWRKAKTYPKSGKNNLFKEDYKCVHCTDTRSKGTRKSKNTNCPIKLQIKVERYVEKSTSAKKDNTLIKEWPTLITIRDDHNHTVGSAEELKYRDLSEETKFKLCELFRMGYEPAEALHVLKTNLLLEHGDEYYEKAVDNFYVPTYKAVHRLFEREFHQEYGNFTDEKTFKFLENQLNIYSAESSGKAPSHQVEDSCDVPVIEDSISEENIFLSDSSAIQSIDIATTPHLTETEEDDFNDLLNRMKAGIRENLFAFVPAVKKMISNAKTFAKTESGLLSAMHTFGIYSGLQSQSKLHKV